jgi:signal peptidase II
MEKAKVEQYLWEYAYLFLVAGMVIALDQASKLWVRSFLEIGETWEPLPALADYLAIIHTWNTGMALGALKGTNGLFLALGEIICIVILFVYPLMTRNRGYLSIGLGLGLILGGALGNLIDRVMVGYVTDIFLVSLLPVFNIADLALVFGAIFLVLSLFFEKNKVETSPGKGTR